jgi:hypothetical protein
MSTERVDYLFRGSHPAFFWAASLLNQKGLNVAILIESNFHSWEIFPKEILSMIGISELLNQRDHDPIQILTSHCRMGIFQDLETTLKDYQWSVGDRRSAEVMRGLSYFAKGSDYPAVYGETPEELIRACHEMVYLEKPLSEVRSQAILHLKKMGVKVLMNSDDLPIAEQTVILDSSRAKVFRSKFEIEFPLEHLPIGSSKRMVLAEGNSPLIEMIHRNGRLTLRTLLPEEETLPQKMLDAVQPYFKNFQFLTSQISIVPRQDFHLEWSEAQNSVDTSRMGIWLISPAINPERGERSLYFRISELLRKKDKKNQVFDSKDFFC